MQSLSSFRKPPAVKSMGIEWETIVERGEGPQEGTYLGFFYVTDDGSLRPSEWGQRGIELVSQPLTPQWLLKELERVNKLLPATFPNASCGIHIHVSRKWCNAERTELLWQFFKEELLASDYEEFFGRVPNRYCENPRGLLSTRLQGRYCAINTTNDNTVEFRMFSSGDVKWAQYCVKLVEYLVNNAKHLNMEALYAFVDLNKPVQS